MYYQSVKINFLLRQRYFPLCLLTLLLTYCNVILADNAAVIAIDIGHTQAKAGAYSARGVGEFQFNQSIAKKLKAQLQQYGFKNSFIINPDGKAIKLKQRTAIAARHYADVFISIHHDSMQPQFLRKWVYKEKKYQHSEKFKGYSLFISQINHNKTQNTQLAHSIASHLLDSNFKPSLHHAMPIKGENRRLIDPQQGIYEFPQLAVLRTAKMPAILVECGVIINKDEELLLSNEAYQQKLAAALADGIVTYLNKNNK